MERRIYGGIKKIFEGYVRGAHACSQKGRVEGKSKSNKQIDYNNDERYNKQTG